MKLPKDRESVRCKCGKLRAEHDAVSRNGKVMLVAKGCDGFREAMV